MIKILLLSFFDVLKNINEKSIFFKNYEKNVCYGLNHDFYKFINLFEMIET
jgi:hypothetical protein